VDPCSPDNDGTIVDDVFFLAPHAVVSRNGQQESTWANGTLIREKKHWAMYFGVDINVECNDCPVAINDTYEAVEDTTLEVPAGTGVLSNDADEEGNPINVVSNTQPENGAVVLNADGSFAYTPNANYCGPDSFTYAVTDGICDEPVSATVNINVECVNDAPDAVDDTASVDEDSSVIVPVLENDVDADGDSLTVESVSEPASGTATDNGDGTITYAPDADFCGADSFQYTISDGELIDTATVTITVNCENTCPVAEDDNYDGIYLDVPAGTGLLSNDVDNDGDTITVESYTQPGDGAVTLNPDGSFIYHTLGPGRLR
jgi:VCBS repeat-containing protein